MMKPSNVSIHDCRVVSNVSNIAEHTKGIRLKVILGQIKLAILRLQYAEFRALLKMNRGPDHVPEMLRNVCPALNIVTLLLL